MADIHAPPPFRYVPTLGLLANVMLRIGSPTLLALLFAYPETTLSWVTVIVIIFTICLFSAWIIRFVARRFAVRKAPRSSPLDRLQGWEESPGQIQFFDLPGADFYPLWSGSFADGLMRRLGKPLGKHGERLIDLATSLSAIAFIVTHLMAIIPGLRRAFDQHVLSTVGLPLWAALLAAVLTYAAMDIRRWARRTRQAIENQRA